jgi:methyl-accepting chemotaxis protein
MSNEAKPAAATANRRHGKPWRMLRRMPIGGKMAVVVAALIVPLIGLMGVFVWQMYKDISFTNAEEVGLAYFHPLEEIGGAVNIRSAALAAAVASGAENSSTVKVDGEIDALIEEMEALDSRYGSENSSLAWKSIRAEWDQLKGSSATSVEESIASHQKLVAMMADLRMLISTDWGMALDPVAASYYALDVAVNQLPETENLIGALRATLAGATSRPEPTSDDRLSMLRLAAITEEKVTLSVKELKIVQEKSADDPLLLEQVNNIPGTWSDGILSWLKEVELAVNDGSLDKDALLKIEEGGSSIPGILDATHDQVMVVAEQSIATRNDGDVRTLVVAILSVLLVCAAALYLAYSVSWRIIGSVKRLQEISAKIAKGDFTNVIDPDGTDEMGQLYAAVDAMQIQLREDYSVRAAAEINIRRLSGGLAATSESVMIADNENNIIFVNDAATDLFRKAQTDLQRELPGFNADALMGGSIDRFHKDPSHARHILAKLSGQHRARLRIGGRILNFTASPILSDQGERLGTVVEWSDQTEIVRGEQEITGAVDAFLQGDLSKRILEEGKVDFHALIAQQMNALIGNVSEIINDVRQIAAHASDGNLEHRVAVDGKCGLAQELGGVVNNLVDTIGVVVNEVQALVASANDGDLTKRIETNGKAGLLVKIGSGINDLTENMASVVSQVKQAASEVSRGADEISQGNSNLSQRTEEQASSLEETASSMEEMTSTVKQNADNAGQASQLAVAARDQAEKGGAVVAKAVRAMTDINDASKKIADIIGVIDEIAFQTNLLALNAAVEAARAGEQGRGFAVVASEVRNLAGRSATAAKEIKALIQDSVKKVDEGSNLVTQSGATLEQIVSAVKKVTDIVAEIAAASNEQTAGIEQVNKAVMQLDELTQQNAALVEEASAASQSMAEQARGLNASMQRYKVNGSGRAEASMSTGSQRRLRATG